MNKKSCALLIALLYPISIHTSQHSKKRKRNKHNRAPTLNIHVFNNQFAFKNKMLSEIRQAEQAIPMQPQPYEHLKSLYAQLLQSPICTDAEIKRWGLYRNLHQQRYAIMNQIHMPEHHASSHAASTATLHNIKALLNLWEKLRDTYPSSSNHYKAFHEKVSILEKAAKEEEFELGLNNFEKAVKLHLNAQKEITNENVLLLNQYAKKLFKSKSNAVLQASPGMKQLAKKITQKEWVKRAQPKKTVTQPKKDRRSISPEEHAQHKIKTSIAVLNAQKNVAPLLRTTALHRLYSELATCSLDKQKEMALHAAQFHGICKQRALLKEKLNLIIQSDNVEILKLARTTAQKLRDTYPAFHPCYAEYDQETQTLQLKIAYMERKPQILSHIKQLSSDPLVINCAGRLLYRLYFEKMLSEDIENKEPYEVKRDTTVNLLSTYDAKEKAFNHYLTKILRADLKQKIKKVQLDSQLSSEERYKHLLVLIQQIITAYPEQHPERKKYIHAQKTISCLKNIEKYKCFILTNKDKPLDKTIAYALSKAYSHLLASCDNLAQLSDASQIAIHTCELGDIEKNAEVYKKAARKFKLLEQLKNLESKNKLCHKDVTTIIKLIKETRKLGNLNIDEIIK